MFSWYYRQHTCSVEKMMLFLSTFIQALQMLLKEKQKAHNNSLDFLLKKNPPHLYSPEAQQHISPFQLQKYVNSRQQKVIRRSWDCQHYEPTENCINIERWVVRNINGFTKEQHSQQLFLSLTALKGLRENIGTTHQKLITNIKEHLSISFYIAQKFIENKPNYHCKTFIPQRLLSLIEKEKEMCVY